VAFSFGRALRCLKNGETVRRQCWAKDGHRICLVDASDQAPAVTYLHIAGAEAVETPHIVFYIPSSQSWSPWSPTPGDLLAADWQCVDTAGRQTMPKATVYDEQIRLPVKTTTDHVLGSITYDPNNDTIAYSGAAASLASTCFPVLAALTDECGAEALYTALTECGLGWVNASPHSRGDFAAWRAILETAYGEYVPVAALEALDKLGIRPVTMPRLAFLRREAWKKVNPKMWDWPSMWTE
jgi:hypothetical protein